MITTTLFRHVIWLGAILTPEATSHDASLVLQICACFSLFTHARCIPSLVPIQETGPSCPTVSIFMSARAKRGARVLS